MKQGLSLIFSAAILLMFSCVTTLDTQAATSGSKEGKHRFTVVIDAGHGGRDAGAVGLISKEKDINLKVALAFGQLIERNQPKVRVIYTRTTDTFVTLQGRADIANRAKADLFISIHTNSVASNKHNVSGAETYTLGMHRAAENLEVAKRENSVITQEAGYQKTYKNFDPRKSESYIIFEFMQDLHMQQSVDLARKVQAQYAQRGRKNKGVHQAGFLVLRATSMPSILTELGFISHPEEERFMNSREGIETLSRSLYESFRAYRRQYASHEDEALVDEETPLLASNEEHSAEKSTPNAATSAALPNAYQPNERELLSAVMTDDETASQAITAEVVPLEALPYPSSLPTQAPRASVQELPSASTPQQETLRTEREEAAAHEALKRQAEIEAARQQERQKAEEKARQEQAEAEARRKAQQLAEEQARRAKIEEEKVRAERQKAETEAKKKAEEQERQKALKAAQQQQKEQQKVPLQKAPEAVSSASHKTESSASSMPVFKVQLLTTERLLAPNDAAFQGVSPIEHYTEGGRHKYTTGASTELNEIKQLRTRVSEKFPEAFIIAMLDGQRIDMKTALDLGRNKGNNRPSPSATSTQGSKNRK